MKNFSFLISLSITLLLTALNVSASKLVSAEIVDKDYIMLYFCDGDVTFTEGASSGCGLYCQCASANQLVYYGTVLNTTNAAIAGNWKITSTDDPNFGGQGVSPSTVYRKSKLGCMAQMAWNNQNPGDFNYDWAYDHTLFLKLPQSMTSGKSYTINIPSDINSDLTTTTITFDIFNSRSEAVKVNIVGYSTANSIKSADVYIWMGDGGPRDYTSFAGKKIYIYNTDTQVSQEVGTLSLWKANVSELGHQMLQSSVWKADFTGFNTAGNYRLAIEDIGCSDDFTISDNIYYEPFKVSTRGFYYQRIGEDNMEVSPPTRRPLFIPGKDPANCVVKITTITPYDADWTTKLSANGDPYDNTTTWANYLTGRTNPNVWGGHADAFDWDRHLGHVAIIYDMLLPYFITKGALSDDNLGIAESGNGIPDIIDEARYEVDFWLRLRDGMGYSHGLNNPVDQTTNPTFYQAGTDAISAWANAANSSMLADCFRISGNSDLMAEYRDSAIVAYTYASNLSNLTQSQDVGNAIMTGKDFRITAAAYLYNLTGDTKYEDDLNTYSNCKTASSTICNINSYDELYAVAGYLFTNRTVHYPTLYNNMKSSIINEARLQEANYSTSRPSRRSTDNNTGWFITTINNERTIVAHALSAAGSADKTLFENALILEADFSLGRNPLNMINMTTATTNLAAKKSVENAYTTGWNDGVPGVAPGITPYMNQYTWGGTMAMGNPTWMTKKNYPAITFDSSDNPTNNPWPYGELYYNTRYVYAANEYTPQQVMRGKTALYGYLYAISPAKQNINDNFVVVPDTNTVNQNGAGTIELNLSIPSNATLTGSFEIQFPGGMAPDTVLTVLAPDLSANCNLSFSPEGNNTWLITISEKGLRRATADEYRKIMDIAYKVAKNVTQGSYDATITNLGFLLDDGTLIRKESQPITITVPGSLTAINNINNTFFNVFVANKTINIESPNKELITIYSADGTLLYSLTKSSDMIKIPLSSLPGGVVFIVKGSVSGTAKVQL